MNESNFGTLSRNAKRALILIGAQNLHPALASQAGKLRGLAVEYFAADANLRALENVAEQLTAKSSEAVADLAKEYDIVRAAIMANAPSEPVGSTASKCKTPDDILGAAEVVKQVLERHASEKWSQPLVQALAQKLAAASKAWPRAFIAQQDLQKVRDSRSSVAEQLSGALVPFRRIVRAVYGSKSKESHSIKAIRTRGQLDDGTDVPVNQPQQQAPPTNPTPQNPT